MRWGLFILPLCVFLVLAVFLWKGLDLKPQELPSALLGRAAPVFNVETIEDPTKKITDNIFKDKVTVLNVWSRACVGCRVEHALWVQLFSEGTFTQDLQLIGLNYHDSLEDAKQCLKHGNPYHFNLFDKNGRLGIDFGVYGTPETFIVDQMGVVRYRHVGPIDRIIWESQFLPVLKDLEYGT